jgi:hypothetical protein
MLISLPLLLAFLSPQTPGRSPQDLAAFSISGTVLKNGTPVQGAEVQVRNRIFPTYGGVSFFAIRTQTRTAKTDKNGHFQVQVPPGRFYSVLAKGEGSSSKIHDLISPPENKLHLLLKPSKSLRGKFSYKGRAPKEKIAFYATRFPMAVEGVPYRVEGVSEENGDFEIKDIPPGIWDIQLKGGMLRMKSPKSIGAGGPVAAIPLIRGIRLRGEVKSGGTFGKTIPGASIEILGASRHSKTQADLNGHFSLEGLEYGPGATLLVKAKGYPKTLIDLEPGLSPRDPSPQIHLQLRPGRRVKGRFVDRNKKPVSGLQVFFRGRLHPSGISFGDLSALLITDADGKLDSSLLDPHTYYEMMAILPSGEVCPILDLPASEEGASVDLGTLNVDGGRVHARIKAPKDITGFDLEVRAYGPKESGLPDAYVKLAKGADGTWNSPSLPEGTYMILSISRRMGFARKTLQILRNDKQPTDYNISLILAPPKKIYGVVVDPGNQPVINREVKLVASTSNGQQGMSTRWSDLVLETLWEKFFPAKKFPRGVKTGPKGDFAIWCFEASGSYDLLVSGKPNSGRGEDLNDPSNKSYREKGILGRPLPITVQMDL